MSKKIETAKAIKKPAPKAIKLSDRDMKKITGGSANMGHN